MSVPRLACRWSRQALLIYWLSQTGAAIGDSGTRKRLPAVENNAVPSSMWNYFVDIHLVVPYTHLVSRPQNTLTQAGGRHSL